MLTSTGYKFLPQVFNVIQIFRTGSGLLRLQQIGKPKGANRKPFANLEPFGPLESRLKIQSLYLCKDVNANGP